MYTSSFFVVRELKTMIHEAGLRYDPNLIKESSESGWDEEVEDVSHLTIEKFKVFRSCAASVSEMKKCMKRDGFQPATLSELVCFAVHLNQATDSLPIIALDSWLNPKELGRNSNGYKRLYPTIDTCFCEWGILGVVQRGEHLWSYYSFLGVKI